MKLRRDQPYGYNTHPVLGGFVPDLWTDERAPEQVNEHAQPPIAPLIDAVQVVEVQV